MPSGGKFRLQDQGRKWTAISLDALGSASTLYRLGNRASRAVAWAAHRELIETFIALFKALPAELVLDFDATDNPAHEIFHRARVALAAPYRALSPAQ